MREICQLCERETAHIGPCDGFGYKGQCSMCTEFIERQDGTIMHEDGTVFAPVEKIQQVHYEVRLPRFPREVVNEQPETPQ